MNPYSFSTSGHDRAHAVCRPICLAALLAGTTFGWAANGWAQTASASETEATARPGDAVGPRIEFASPVFDFGRVSQGEVVRHDFQFINSGTAVLEIRGVNPGCGCTTAGKWDRRVEPGQRGVIPLRFNSSTFSGSISKAVTVISNDPRQSNITLQIKGTVWKAFEVTPARAVFNVSSEAETGETKVLRIISQVDEPVTLSDVENSHPSFRADLITVKPGKEFELRITALPPFGSAPVTAPISLRTSSSAAPTIRVTAQVIVQQPVVALPSRITLPTGPVSTPARSSFIVRNNGKMALALSDATVNVPGADVRIEESQPNRLFRVKVEFPAGFEARPEDVIEVSVKSNHPKFPIIRVPVVAAPRPAVEAAVQVPLTSGSTGTPLEARPK